MSTDPTWYPPKPGQPPPQPQVPAATDAVVEEAPVPESDTAVPDQTQEEE